MKYDGRIQEKIRERSLFTRIVAVIICFAVLIAFIMPLQLMKSGAAISKADMLGDNLSTKITGTSLSLDAIVFGDAVDAGNVNSANVWFKVDYLFNISSTNIKVKDQPYFYFELTSSDVNLISDFKNLKASDNAQGWQDWKKEKELDSKYPSATYDVYQADDNKVYIQVKLNDEYIDYIKSGNGEVIGSVKFSADVDRGNTQDGDKNVKIGDAELKVSFDDKVPSLNKNGSVSGTDAETGLPIITWTITASNYYELSNYTLSDTHLASHIPGSLSAVDANGNTIGISSRGNEFVFDDASTNSSSITITYKTLATEDELKDTTGGHKGLAQNTVSLNYPGTPDASDEVDLNADFMAKLTKTGTPSYNYDGSKGWIYWTLKVSRDFKQSLDGYVINDTIAGAKIVSVENADQLSGDAPWTISGHDKGKVVTIVYKTPIEIGSNKNVTNGATITPPGGDSPDDTKEIQVTYNDNNLFNINKYGSFDEESELVNWTIEINGVSKEKLNGYIISDAAFGRSDIKNLVVNVSPANGNIKEFSDLADLESGSESKYKVKPADQIGEISTIKITYSVPLTDDEKDNRKALTSGQSMKVENDLGVDPGDGRPDKGVKGEANVGSGYIGITANKNWSGYFTVEDRTYPVTLDLEKKVGEDGDWNVYDTKTIDKATDEQFVKWDSLPKRENGKAVYYRVREKVTAGADYTVSYDNDYGVITDAVLNVYNSWNKMAVSVSKVWSGDSGHENERPEIKMHLMKSNNGYEWSDTGKYAKIKNNVTTYFDENDTQFPTQGWSNLEKGNNIRYKVVEDPVKGYDSIGSGELYDTGSYTITNTSNNFNLTVNKVWNDGGATTRTPVQFDLYSSSDKIAWTLVGSKTLSNKENGSITWEWLDGRDENGNPIYYKVEENTVPADYTVSYDKSEVTGGYGDQTFTVTNTWNKLNLNAVKNWEGIPDSERPDEVTVELWRKLDGGSWQKMTEVDDTFTPATVSIKKSDSWRVDKAWTGLPKTVKVDDTDVTAYYAIREVGTNSDYISVYDTNGVSNSSGDSVVTNKSSKITVKAKKEWLDSKTDKRGSSPLVFHLERTIHGGASEPEVIADSRKSLSSSNWNEELVWDNLPVQDPDGEVYFYKVVEDTKLSDYTTSYSPEYISESDGTITVTNKEKARYSKFAIDPKYSALTYEKDGASHYYNASDSTSLTNEAKVLVISNVTNSITAKMLNEADNVATVDINGTETECYIFRWFVDISSNKDKLYIDQLPNGSVFYLSEKYPAMFWDIYNNGSNTVLSSIDALFLEYNSSINILQLKSGPQPKWCSYCTAVPKNTVDSAIENSGEYIINNKIREENEPDFVEAELKITNSAVTGAINKNNTNDKSEIKADSKELAIGDARAYYTVDVNSNAQYLSNGDSVTVTDSFKVLKYLTSSGEVEEGYNIVDAALENVRFYEYDNATGKRKPLESGVSYVSSTDSSPIEKVVDLSSIYPETSLDFNPSNRTLSLMVSSQWEKYSKGSTLVIQLKGETGKPVALMGIPDNIKVDASSKTFVNGSVTLAITFLEDITSDIKFQSMYLSDQYSTWGDTYATGVSFVSYTENETVEATQYITNFTVPDGKHIVIEYEYLLTNPDGSPIGRNLSLWLENESIVHTSGGDENSTVAEDKYSVTGITGDITTGGVSKIVKVDVGNYSVKNLKAEFILAKFVDGDWVYATGFPGLEGVDSFGNPVVSAKDHSISYENAVSEKQLTKIPTESQAARIEVDQAYNLQFENNMLYKLIELKAPDGYFATGYVEGQSTVDDMLPFTTYFTYVYGQSRVSDEVRAAAGILENNKITMLNDLGNIEIPNVKPVSVGASKVWEQDPASVVNNPSVTVELWKSYLQTTSSIPAASNDLSRGAVKVANADQYFASEIKDAANWTTDYGIGNSDGTFTLIRQGEGPYIWSADKIWVNLPNGENGKPIYYYVKEVAYTIGDKTYSLNSEGKFVDSDGNVYTDAEGVQGEYRPTYANNAIGEDGSATITNSRRFTVKKVWMRSDGQLMKNPPNQVIQIKLEGYSESSKEWKEILLGSNNVLSTENNWELEVPQSYLAAYSRFRVTELNPPNNYTVSPVYELDGTVGVVSLINKSQSPSKTSLGLTKHWGDDRSHDPITVVLYQATSEISNADLAAMSEGTMPANAEEINLEMVNLEDVESPVVLDSSNDWEYIWEDLPYADAMENRLYYFAVEKVVPDGYTVTYSKTTNGVEQTEIITNTIPGGLAVSKNWVNADGNPVTVNDKDIITLDLYRDTLTADTSDDNNTPEVVELNDPQELEQKINSGTLEYIDSVTIKSDGNGNWSTVIEDLPMHPEGENDSFYVYYVVENNGERYNVVYSGNGKILSEEDTVGISLTNTNSFEPIDITVNKVWPDASTLPEGTSIPSSVSVVLYSSWESTDDESKWTEEDVVSLTDADNWSYKFTGLNGLKYWYVKESVDGWSASYDGNGVYETSGTITITNTIDTGNISVTKNWLNDRTGGNTMVKVKVYRVAYDGNGNPIYEYQPRLSSSRTAFSASRMRAALASVSDVSSSEETTASSILNYRSVKTQNRSAFVKIQEADLPLTISPISGTYYVNSEIVLTVSNAIDGIKSVTSSVNGVVYVQSVSDKTIILKALDECDGVRIEVEDNAGEKAFAEFVIEKVNAVKPALEHPDWLWNKTLDLVETNKWKTSLENLPLTDGRGHRYTYYFEEVIDNGPVNYHPIYYSESSGFELIKGETKDLSLTNKANEEHPVELPETGGMGTKSFAVTGLAMMAGAGLLFIYSRRDRRKKRKSA